MPKLCYYIESNLINTYMTDEEYKKNISMNVSLLEKMNILNIVHVEPMESHFIKSFYTKSNKDKRNPFKMEVSVDSIFIESKQRAISKKLSIDEISSLKKENKLNEKSILDLYQNDLVQKLGFYLTVEMIDKMQSYGWSTNSYMENKLDISYNICFNSTNRFPSNFIEFPNKDEKKEKCSLTYYTKPADNSVIREVLTHRILAGREFLCSENVHHSKDDSDYFIITNNEVANILLDEHFQYSSDENLMFRGNLQNMKIYVNEFQPVTDKRILIVRKEQTFRNNGLKFFPFNMADVINLTGEQFKTIVMYSRYAFEGVGEQPHLNYLTLYTDF